MKKDLSKAYQPLKYEDDIYKKWEESGYFQPENDRFFVYNKPNLKAEKVEKYTISMPPPNRTGVLHIGHASMLTIQDILIRYNRMLGKKVLWLPGSDHAAIATQTKVEKILKQEGTDRHKLGRDKFLKRVKEFAQNSHDNIVNQIKKIGSSCDWSREAYTLDETRNKAVRSVFKMMYDDGLIYRGERVVNWCPRCHSTLADDEVEYKTENSKLYWIKYGPFVLATARPETKLGDTAVAVHPSDKRYKDMIGKKYMIPGVLGKFEIIVVADRAVDSQFGSGAIKVTPAHSMVDYEIAQRHNLPTKKIINEDGVMMENCGKYAGMTTRKAREAIVIDMQKMGLIDHIDEDYKHNASICYRCDTPIEPLPSLQWFINVNKKIPKVGKSIKELAVEAVKKGVFGRDRIKIIPNRFEKSYFHWMENLHDWCISRQIWFGHQIPVWHKKNKKNEDEIYVGIEAPQGKEWEQDADTLDTWFSSGLWTFSTLAHNPNQISIKSGKLHIDSDDFKNFHPTQVLETGYDIIFFWVARMIMMTTYAIRDIPFEDVYMHGLILDNKGKKMSKSKNNVIDPLDMIKKYGADATRLSLVTGSTPGNDLCLNEEKIEGCRNLVNKLWNISRYIIMSTESVAKKKNLKYSDLKLNNGFDLWIIKEFNEAIKKTNNYLKNYSFSMAGEVLTDFTLNKLADWYLEVSKFSKSNEKREILLLVLKDLLKLWHPFIPFITEVVWQEIAGAKETIMISKYPDVIDLKIIFVNKKTRLTGEHDIELIIKIIKAIRNARAENKVNPSKKIKAIIYAGNRKKIIQSQSELIKKLRTGIDELEVKQSFKNSADGNSAKIKDSIYIAVDDVEIYLIGAIDKDKEEARIKKEIENFKKIIINIEKKLSNKKFIDKAPKKIVNEERNKLKLRKEELKKMQKQFNSLK